MQTVAHREHGAMRWSHCVYCVFLEGDVKFKVIKLSDVEFVDEEDEVENAEGVPREGDSSSTKENKVRVSN